MESWVLDKLQRFVLADEEVLDAANERFVEIASRRSAKVGNADRMARELQRISDTVTALTMNTDPADLSLLNARLTQLCKQKEALEAERCSAERSSGTYDVAALRHWARTQLACLRDAMAGTRNDRMRDVIAT